MKVKIELSVLKQKLTYQCEDCKDSTVAISIGSAIIFTIAVLLVFGLVIL